MFEWLMTLPQLVQNVVVFAFMLLMAFICAIAWRGFSLRTRLLSIDTTAKEKNDSGKGFDISSNHIVHYKNLRKTLKRDVKDCGRYLYASFRTLFINAEKDAGVSNVGIEKHPEVSEFLSILERAIDNIFVKSSCYVIFGDHFPERKKDDNGNYSESEKEFSDRFKLQLSNECSTTIYKLMLADIGSDWEIGTITYSDFEKKYLMSEDSVALFNRKVHGLLMKSLVRRDDLFEQIIRNDNSEFRDLVSEWEIVYG